MFIVIVLILLFLLYIWLTWNYNYWKKHNVPYLEPSLIFGNYKSLLLVKECNADFFDKFYWKYVDEPALGLYKLRQPQLLIRDPTLVHMVLSQDFNSFHDNDMFVKGSNDPVMGLNPFFVHGEEWKWLRKVTTPSLTPIKIKGMIKPIIQVCKDMIEFIKEREEKQIEIMYFTGQYTTDVVCATVFGLKSNSFKDPNSQFRKMTEKILVPDFFTSFVLLLTSTAPWINNIFKLRLMPSEVHKFFTSIVKSASDYRKENNIHNNDFLQHMLDSKEKNGYSYADIAAHTINFLIDGYKTSSLLMGHCLYQLGLHKNVQEKLRTELINKNVNLDEVDADTIISMPYLDAVIKESLRLYPPLTSMTKLCTKDIKISNGEKKYTLQKGMTVALPIFAIHRDPKYFTEPTVFKPERFLTEDINSQAFFPFSLGPRMCPGSKFALLQIKTAIYALVLHFEIYPTNISKEKFGLDPHANIFCEPKDELLLCFKYRNPA